MTQLGEDSRPAAPEQTELQRSRIRLVSVMIPTVYPIITALVYLMLPLTEGWEIWQRTMLMTPMMVGIIVFVISPLVNRRFSGYISKKPR